jgi:hypothetical protein
VHSQPRGDYVSSLYAGLFELSAAGDVVLRFSRQQIRSVRESGRPVTLRIDVEGRGARRPLKVCFDTEDWPSIASMDDIRTADVYFKRSYHAPYIEQLEPQLQRKIVPMGLHYACSSRNESFGQSVRDTLARDCERCVHNGAAEGDGVRCWYSDKTSARGTRSLGLDAAAHAYRPV